MSKFLLITSFILLTAIQSQGQSSERPVPEVSGPIVKLYPNPATTYVTFDFQKNFQKGISIQLYSFLGKKMYESPVLSEKTTIDLSEFNRGVYIYHIRDLSGKIIEQGKFQVSK